jgi:hypothetical protein
MTEIDIDGDIRNVSIGYEDSSYKRKVIIFKNEDIILTLTYDSRLKEKILRAIEKEDD